MQIHTRAHDQEIQSSHVVQPPLSRSVVATFGIHSNSEVMSASNQISYAPTAQMQAMRLQHAIGRQPTCGKYSLLQLQRLYGNHHVQRVVTLARQSNGVTEEVSPEIEATISRKLGGGQALDSTVRGQMEAAFGTNFEDVRVHTDGEAAMLNQALSARAFTTGKDIFFQQGEYNPGNSSGQALLAHELTHVVQQNGAAIQGKLTVSQPYDTNEVEADQVAKQVMTMIQTDSSDRGMLASTTNGALKQVNPQLAILTHGLHLARRQNNVLAVDLLQRAVDFATKQPDHPLLARTPILSPAAVGGTCACGGAILPGGECSKCMARRLQRQGGPTGEIQRTLLARQTIARQERRRTTVQCINANLANAGIPWAIITIVGGICGIIGAVATSPSGPGAAAGGVGAAAVCIAGVTGLSVGMVLGIITRCIQDPSVEWVFAQNESSAAAGETATA